MMAGVVDLGTEVHFDFKLFKADELEIGATYRTCFYNESDELIWPPIVALVTLVEPNKLLLDCESIPSLHGTVRNIRKDTKDIQRYIQMNG